MLRSKISHCLKPLANLHPSIPRKKIKLFNIPCSSITAIKTTNKYTYFTLVDKPIPTSYTLNSMVQLSSQALSYGFVEWSVPAEVSVLIGGVMARLAFQVVGKLVEEMRFNNYDDRWIGKFVKKAFLVDLARDVKFYVSILIYPKELSQRKSFLMHKYYKVSHLCKNLLTFYLSMNFLRGCHYILQNDHLYSTFTLHTQYLPTLANYDPKFILPLVPALLTYFWISKSRHPMLIHLNQEGNLFWRINLAFMTGLVFVPLPGVYALAYSGLLTGHLMIRGLFHVKDDLREDLRQIVGTKDLKAEKKDGKNDKITENNSNNKQT